MKDIIITPKHLIRELIVFIVCIVLACLLNVYAIITYHRPWMELISQIGFVIVVGIGIYVLVWVVRLIYYIIRYIIRGICHCKAKERKRKS